MELFKLKAREIQVIVSILAISAILYISIEFQASLAQESANKTMTCSIDGGNATALAAGCKCERCICSGGSCDCINCTCG